MKRARYLAVIAGRERPANAPEFLAPVLSLIDGAEPVIDTPGLAVIANPVRTARIDSDTIVIGHANRREGGGTSQASRAPAPAFTGLIERHWGDYVAISRLPRSGAVALLRAPMGGTPCYWARLDGLTLVASDVAMLIAAGIRRPAVDFEALARELAAGELRTEETCLAGINEIRGGGAATFKKSKVDLEC